MAVKSAFYIACYCPSELRAEYWTTKVSFENYTSQPGDSICKAEHAQNATDLQLKLLLKSCPHGQFPLPLESLLHKESRA